MTDHRARYGPHNPDDSEFLGDTEVLAVGEPIRRGGTAAAVVHPSQQ
jgi:hypothetical protein